MLLQKFTNPRVRKVYARMLIKTALSMICVGIALYLTVACISHYRYTLNHVQILEDIGARGRANEMLFGSYEMTFLPEYIGKVDDLGYYFFYRPECSNEFCVVSMYDDEYAAAEQAFDENGSVSMQGVLEKITEPIVVDYIIQYAAVNDIPIDTGGETLEDYIYEYPMMMYHEEGSGFNQFFNVSYMYLLGIFIFGLLGLSTVWGGLSAVKRSRGIAPVGMNEAARINEELNAPDARWFPVHRIYLTKNYLVVLGGSLLFLRMAAIGKISGRLTESFSQGGLTYVRELFAEYRDDGETYVLAKIVVHSLQKKGQQRLLQEQEEIFEYLQEILPESVRYEEE